MAAQGPPRHHFSAPFSGQPLNMAIKLSRRPLWLLSPLWLGLAIFASAPSLHAQAPSAAPTVAASAAPSVAPTASASVAAPPPAPPEEPEDVAAIRTRTVRILALLDATLKDDIDPKTLFDVDLDDARAVAVEIERLRRVLAKAEQAAGGVPPVTDAGVADAGAPDAAGPPAPDAGPVDGGAPDAAAPQGAPRPAAEPDPTLLQARLELDRARLAFYELSKGEREALFTKHAEQRAKDTAKKAQEDLSEAEREQREAAADRARAEAEAKRADTEAKRLVAEERVRLLGVKESQASLAADLARDRIDLGGFDEQLLSWQRPADDILAAEPTKRPSASSIDGVYDELRNHLADIRTKLGAAVGERLRPTGGARAGG